MVLMLVLLLVLLLEWVADWRPGRTSIVPVVYRPVTVSMRLYCSAHLHFID